MIHFIFLLPVLTFAQVNFYGYFESEYDHIKLQQTDYNFGYNKLRLDLESRPNENVFIGGNINFRLFHGKTVWDIFDFLPMDTVIIGMDTVTTMYQSFLDEMYMDNIYLRSSFPVFDITIGRQPISMGTGYAWNPLDIFNRKDLIDPTYEQPGINALRVEIPLMGRNMLEAIVTPDSTWDMSTKMIQVKSGLGSFDVSINGAYQYHLIPRNRGGYMHDGVYFVGSSFVGELWKFGLWGETIWSLDIYEKFAEIMFGVDYTLNNGFYLICEFFYNSLGAEKKDLEFDHYLHNYSGLTHSLMQNYIFLMGRYNITNYITGSIISFGNLDDHSFILAPQIDFDILEDITLSASVNQSFGNENTEFGLQNSSMRLRIRAYY